MKNKSDPNPARNRSHLKKKEEKRQTNNNRKVKSLFLYPGGSRERKKHLKNIHELKQHKNPRENEWERENGKASASFLLHY